MEGTKRKQGFKASMYLGHLKRKVGFFFFFCVSGLCCKREWCVVGVEWRGGVTEGEQGGCQKQVVSKFDLKKRASREQCTFRCIIPVYYTWVDPPDQEKEQFCKTILESLLSHLTVGQRNLATK